MKEYNFNFERRTLLTHLISAFGGVHIYRYDGDKYAKEKIKVPFTFSPKSSILQDLINKAQHVRLPIMAFRVSSEGRDDSRIKNKMDDIVYRERDGTHISLKAIPWTINGTLSILAKYSEDIDQIIQNITVHTNPYVVVSWREPKSNKELRTEIYWDSNVSYTYPGDKQSGDEPLFRVEANINLSIKGWIFRTNIENPVSICSIHTDIIPTNKFFCSYDLMEDYAKNNAKDEYDIYGRPDLKYVKPFYIKEGFPTTITVQGDGFADIHAIYLSADNPEMYPMTFHQPSTAYDGFYGYMLPDVSVSDPQKISFSIPPPSGFGLLDIIMTNKCGYGKLTEDANRCARVENPYPSHMPEHYSWCVQQFPFINGIMVTNNFNTDINYQDEQIIEFIESTNADREDIIEIIRKLMIDYDINKNEL